MVNKEKLQKHLKEKAKENQEKTQENKEEIQEDIYKIKKEQNEMMASEAKPTDKNEKEQKKYE